MAGGLKAGLRAPLGEFLTGQHVMESTTEVPESISGATASMQGRGGISGSPQRRWPLYYFNGSDTGISLWQALWPRSRLQAESPMLQFPVPVEHQAPLRSPASLSLTSTALDRQGRAMLFG